MTNYFPADVSVRVVGKDLEAAQVLYRDAANLLYRALEFQRAGERSHVRFFQEGSDGSLISVFLSRNIKQVFIAPAVPIQPILLNPKPGELEQPTEPFLLYLMYSGVVKPDAMSGFPEIIQVANPDDPPVPATVSALKQYFPDTVTAQSYNLIEEWQNPIKLGVNTSGGTSNGTAAAAHPKPGSYSGAMKRVVQALYGIGKVITDTEEYISGALPPTEPDLSVWNQYDFHWSRTHGIHKGSDGSVWLVEISKLNGVLAMPLPIFNKTDTQEYLNTIAELGDTDTLNVLFEFGGIPTGEPFPTGTTLSDAIASGKVIVLMSPSALADFYVDSTYAVNKQGSSEVLGWAFSESGHYADNLCFWYKRPDIALAPGTVWGTDGFAGSAADLRFMCVQHYRIVLEIINDPTGVAAGVGSAIMSLVEDNTLQCNNERPVPSLPEYYNAPVYRVPWGFNNEDTYGFRFFGRDEPGDAYTHPPVFLFYVGETLEIVRYEAVFGDLFARGSFYGDSITYGIPVQPTMNSVGLIIPEFCREGYILLYGQTQGYAAGETYPIESKGFFAQLGEIAFPTMADPVLSTIVFGTSYSMLSWISLWCNYDSFLYSYPGDFPMHMGVVINAGPSVSAVMNHGLFVHTNSDSAMPFTRTMETRYDQIGVGPYQIDTDTPAYSVTFVGSP